MTFTSYAQNFEDVLLWRALGQVENGRYLDIGAQDPILDSVSKAFHLAGWAGIHVEPTPAYAEALRKDRLEDLVVQKAISEAGKSIIFYEFAETGLSTGVESVAKIHVENGFKMREIEVSSTTLDQLFADIGPRDIHWMKIDVEGMEQTVLRSWGSNPAKPWIVLVESTLPLTQKPTHEQWIDLILSRGYHEVYFDGLSRYFVADGHEHLDSAFAAPPNIFDGFNVTVHHFSTRNIHAVHDNALQSLRAETDSALQASNVRRQEAEGARNLLESQLNEERERGRRELDELRETLVNRREEAAQKIGALEESLAEQRTLRRAATLAERHWRTKLAEKQAETIRLETEVAAIRERSNELQAELIKAAQNSEEYVQKLSYLESKAQRDAGLIRTALAEPLPPWHRLGRALRLGGTDRVRDLLTQLFLLPSPPEYASRVSMNFQPFVREQRNPYLRADSLFELLCWEDVDFVRCAYVTMLGRQPDPEGEAYYANRIRRGHSKMEVLGQLRRSSEGRLHDPGIAGLDRALRKARWERMPVFGGIVRICTNGAGNRPFMPIHQSTDECPRVDQTIQPAEGPASNSLGERPFVKTVDDLLSFHDEEFVRYAYICLLGRTVDPDGLNHFVRRVRKGVDRRQILAELYRSAESQEHKPQILGLEAVVRPHLRRRWIPSWLLRSRAAEERRHMRSMINEVHRIEARFRERLGQIEAGHGERLAQIESRLQAAVAKTGEFSPVDELSRRNASDTLLAVSRNLALCASEPRNALPRQIYYFVDHTVLCPVNTGMQRLVRQLGRCLVGQGEVIRFVKWNPDTKTFVFISKAELDHLAQWNGPVVPEEDLHLYTENGSAALTPEAGLDLWLVVPEVTHVTYQKQAPTLDTIMAAKAMGAKVAFIYYDAIPLRLPEYKGGAAAHERYMQSLLLADAIIPISRRSAAELQEFFVRYQSATSLPQIEAIQLPGESMIAPRAKAKRRKLTEKLILSVGSIEPRKNQLALIAAFEQFAASPEGAEWKLVLAGHLRGDVAAEVNAAMSRNDRIRYVPHPSDAELDKLYRSAAFTVFPSVEEGFGLPILESLWYGVPCICADFGAMAEVADGGGCLTIDTRNVAEIRAALSRLASNPRLLSDLSAQAVGRPMANWADYARSVGSVLSRVGDSTSHLHAVYFWVGDTCRNPGNSGIQRVVRQLARALIAQGYNLIPAKWFEGRLNPVSADELAHLEKWNGPSQDQWGSWINPEDSPLRSWLIIPELVHGQLAQVRNFAQSAGLRCAAIFYDAIPYKMKEVFGHVFAAHHEEYMLELAKFDKIFSISRHSHNDIKDFMLERRIRNNSFDHRFEVVSTLGPLIEHPRVQSVKRARKRIHILSVISIEPRKNPLTLLKAFARAAKEGSREIRLTVVGRRIPTFNSLAAEVESFAKQTAGVEWLQDVDDARLARLYAEADFTVFPSLEEGFGLPIIESLWHGRPCIVHDTGAMAEIAEGGGCVAVDMKSSDRLADAILSLASDDRRRAELAEASIRRPISSWDDYARDIMRSISLDRLDDRMQPVARPRPGDITKELVNLGKRPTLSVCISTYNRGAWLAVNLRNLFEQIPNPMADIEILVVDNASEDNTEEVVEPYLHRPDFRFLRNSENVGMLGNLTVTAHEARGEYVWILGDDDLVKSNGILKVLEVIKANPGVALIYPNYAYTQERDPENVGDDIQKFLDACPALTPACEDVRATVKEIADKNENLFTAIYCLIFRRDHALRAYSQDTSGRPFSTMRTSIPTTHYVLNYMMDEPAYWIGSLLLVVNFNVSWDKYAPLQILERVPEAQELAERLGSTNMDRWRENLIPGFVHYWREILENDLHGNAEYFCPDRVVMRMKHLDSFATLVPELAAIYDRAYLNGHRSAILPTTKLFNAFH